MKRRAIVSNIDDPKSWGRIRVRLFGYDETGNETPWCWPCSTFAGPGYGFYCLPVVGDEVWVEKSADGEWVWVGFFWNGRKAKPDDGTRDVRVFRTPIGHQLKLDDKGDVVLEHSNGSTIALRQNTDIEVTQKDSSSMIMKANGDIVVTAKQNILLNDSGSCRVVNTLSICHYDGLPHSQGSKTVYSEKP